MKEEEVIHLLARDVAATLGHEHVRVVIEEATTVRSWIVDDSVRFEETLIAEVQQYFHESAPYR